jgi:hypothetical protein
MTAVLAPHPELGAPVGDIRPPIARANAMPPRAAKGNRAPGATRSRAQAYAAAACAEQCAWQAQQIGGASPNPGP